MGHYMRFWQWDKCLTINGINKFYFFWDFDFSFLFYIFAKTDIINYEFGDLNYLG